MRFDGGAFVPVERETLARDVVEVARGLLGALLTTQGPDGATTLRITEVEAYGGADDPGSHAARGRGARHAVMFGEPGRLYVYRHLGIHHCVNVVAEPDGTPAAVLIRAGEVIEGVDLARRRRTRAGVARTDIELASGPGRLAVALGVDLTWSGLDVVAGDGSADLRRPVTVESVRVRSGARVGVSGAGGSGLTFPWRFWIADEPTVSAYRAAAPGGRGSAHG